ncbi:membrane hypothetical protein [Gammaproteobacteria bacterium]
MKSLFIYESIKSQDPPLCVDLDGTLINTDLLIESLFALLRQAPLTIFLIPFWLLQGRAYLKEQLVCRVQIDASVLPYHSEFLAYLRQHHATGRRLVLATASHWRFAEQVACHLGIFESVLATQNGQNLSRARKGECLAGTYGERGFDYAGNSRADLAVWSRARAAILVNPVPGVENKARTRAPIAAIFDDRQGVWKIYLRTLRPRRWIKNLLIFLPLFLSQRYTDPVAWIQAGWAFFSFCSCASSVYLLCDLLNLAIDRHLPHKRDYSFVAGTMSIIHGAILVPSLLMVTILMAVPLPLEFLTLLIVYYFFSLIYYVYSRSALLLDGTIKSGLYTTRLLAGWIALEIPISLTLLASAFVVFFGIILGIELFHRRINYPALKDEATEKKSDID